jgi:hypothetical protein
MMEYLKAIDLVRGLRLVVWSIARRVARKMEWVVSYDIATTKIRKLYEEV